MKREVVRRVFVLIPAILAFAWLQNSALVKAGVPLPFRAAGLAIVGAQLVTHVLLLALDGRCNPSEGNAVCNALAGAAGAAHLLLLSRISNFGWEAWAATAVAAYMVASHVVTIRPLDPLYA